MGGVLHAVFGGGGSSQQSTSQQTATSQSGNQAYPWAMNALAPSVSAGQGATSLISALLGAGGDTGAADAAFKNYLGSSGYNFMMDQGTRALTGNAATKGLLHSGGTLKAVSDFGQKTGTQYFNNYLTNLGALAGLGQNAANSIIGAGQYGTSSSTGTSQSTGKSDQQSGIIPVLFGK
jgi:hypothetical protein